MEKWMWALIALIIASLMLCSIVARLDRKPGGSLRLIGVELMLLVGAILHYWLGMTAPIDPIRIVSSLWKTLWK